MGIQPVRMEERSGMAIVGISVITTNADEMSGKGKIGALWDRFYSDGISSKILGQAKDNVTYGCYTDYESGAAGRYRVLIGTRVQSAEAQPEELEVLAIPSAKYAVFTTARGPVQEVVSQAWTDIWQWSATSGMKRTYTGDFECYDEQSADPTNAQVDIYIAVE